MALVPTQIIDRDGHAETLQAAAAGDTFNNTGTEVLHIKNSGGTARTVTVPATKACSHGYLHDASVSVPITTGDRFLGPFPLDQFGTTPNINYSSPTGLTISVLKVAG